ncbi:MAG: hypothetical protein K5651_08115 [Bacteroidales bacterium]|nr:hypothetical protein [Bacteroidales bacterium]
MDSCRLWKKTHRYGLIGYPIAHSGSPALFRQAYSGKWPYDLIENPSFEEAWQAFLDGYDAINITAPFKEKAAARADIQSPEVQSIGAANIAVKTRCGVRVFNSDYLGVRMLLQDWLAGPWRALCVDRSGARGSIGAGVDAEAGCLPRVAVVGYGGAGKAAAAAAKDMGLEVQVFNRSDHGLAFIRPLTELPQASADLLIYSLPMLVPEMQSWMDVIRSGAVSGPLCCIEANYRDPVLAPRNGTATASGLRSSVGFSHRSSAAPAPARDEAYCFGEYIPGEKWLLAQAVTGYEILTGEKPRF